MPAKPKRTESHKARNQIKKTVARRIEQSTKPSQITEVTNEQDRQHKDVGFEGGNVGAGASPLATPSERQSRPSRPSQPKPMKPPASAYENLISSEATFSNAKATPPKNFHKLKKRRAPTPTRRLADNTDQGIDDEIMTGCATKNSTEISEETKMLQQKLATLNAQLNYIDKKAKKLSAVEHKTTHVSKSHHSSENQTDDVDAMESIQQDASISEDLEKRITPDSDQVQAQHQTDEPDDQIGANSPSRVRFDLENTIIINDYITRYFFDTLGSSEEDDYFDHSDAEEQTLDQSVAFSEPDDSLSGSGVENSYSPGHAEELSDGFSGFDTVTGVPVKLNCLDFESDAMNENYEEEAVEWPAPPTDNILLEQVTEEGESPENLSEGQCTTFNLKPNIYSQTDWLN